MASHSEAEEQFFDTHDEIACVSDFVSDCSDDCCSSGVFNDDLNAFGYEVWAETPESSRQHRQRFLIWMDTNFGGNQIENERRRGFCSKSD
ncbi:hypothetical protein U1Q18_036512 [Sarracenia purpurea var. burkii]